MMAAPGQPWLVQFVSDQLPRVLTGYRKAVVLLRAVVIVIPSLHRTLQPQLVFLQGVCTVVMLF